MKARIEGLNAEHTLAHSRLQAGTPEFIEEEEKHFPPSAQPIVLRHPRTHRSTLARMPRMCSVCQGKRDKPFLTS